MLKEKVKEIVIHKFPTLNKCSFLHGLLVLDHKYGECF